MREKIKEEIKKMLEENFGIKGYDLEMLAEELSKYDNILEKLKNGEVFDEAEAEKIYWEQILDILDEQIYETLHAILNDEVRKGKLIRVRFGDYELYIRAE